VVIYKGNRIHRVGLQNLSREAAGTGT
jgi:hypothetical protein